MSKLGVDSSQGGLTRLFGTVTTCHRRMSRIYGTLVGCVGWEAPEEERRGMGCFPPENEP